MFRVDIKNKCLVQLKESDFSSLNILERYDIQEWLEKRVDIVGEDLLLISKELPLQTGLRLDLLAIDKSGNLVVIELKRNSSDRNIEFQAIKYASFCSTLLRDDIVRIHSEYLNISIDEASNRISEYINVDLNEINQDQRIILVALDFHSDIVSSVLWLRDYEINIECLRIKPFVDNNGEIFIHPDKIIPIPEAKDYIQKKEIKTRETKRLTGHAGLGSLINSVTVDLSNGRFRFERYESQTIKVVDCDSNQPVIAKPKLRQAIEELGLNVNPLLGTGGEKNTRTMGRDVIVELMSRSKGQSE